MDAARARRAVARCLAWWQENPRGIALAAGVFHGVFAIRRCIPGPKGILLIFTGAVGDVVTLSPVIRELSRQHPGVSIDILVKGGAVGVMLRACPYLDRKVAFAIHEETACKWRRMLQALWPITRRRSYMTAVLTMGTGWLPPHRIWGLLLLYASGAKRRIAFADECDPWRNGPAPIRALPLANEVVGVSHPQRTDRFMELFRKTGLLRGGEREDTEIWTSREDELQAAGLDECFAGPRDGRPIVLVCPAIGSGPGKLWPAGRYVKVIHDLIQVCNARVFVDGRDRDWLLCKTIATLAPPSKSLIGRNPLGSLCALIRRVDLVIASDSGPIHIAAGTGTPAVAIFGPTDPTIWAPKSSRLIVLRKSDCPPCDNPFYCRRGAHFACTTEVRTSDVIEACRRLLLGHRPRERQPLAHVVTQE
jgi:ADP-heptose:LPS heptosyltransferase